MFYGERTKVIGERIKKNRKRLGLTQKELLENVYLSEKSVASLRKWEKGERLPDLETLARMSEIFDCDIGYLLGDYDEKKRDISDICSITGLSSEAGKVISTLGDKHDGFRGVKLEALNFLLISKNFENALHELVLFKKAEREAARLEKAKREAISKLKDISEYHPNVSFLELISEKRKEANYREYNLSKTFTFLVAELKRIANEEAGNNG